MKPQQILQKLWERIEKNVAGDLENPPEFDDFGKVIKLQGGGLFYEFEWMPDSYDEFLEKEKELKWDSKKKVIETHGQDFVVDTNPKVSSLKLQGIPDAVYPFATSADDPYEAA